MVLERLRALFLPHLCFLCRQHHPDASPVCDSCVAVLPFFNTQQGCVRCGLPLGERIGELPVCGQCLKHAPHFDACIPLFLYEILSAYWIAQLKFHHQFATAVVLAALWASRLNAYYAAYRKAHAWPDAIIPIPLHRRRLWQRGFNQSIVLGKALTQQLSVPLLTNVLVKQQQTPPQVGLSSVARRRNVRHTFRVEQSVPRHVALLDDVVTTGSTVNEAARVLKVAGAQQVSVWCVARRGMEGIP